MAYYGKRSKKLAILNIVQALLAGAVVGNVLPIKLAETIQAILTVLSASL